MADPAGPITQGAKRAGFPTNKYWVTVAVVWAVAGLIAALGAGKSTTPPVTSAAVPVTQVVADCSAVQVDTMGVGSYQCVIDFASGERQSQNTNVDGSGAWVTVA